MRQNPSRDVEDARLDDGQWDLMKSAFHAKKRPMRKRDRKGGRPPLPPRLVFDALLWHLASGLPWSCLPERFGSPRTVHRRLGQWLEQDGLGTAWRRYLENLPCEKLRQWNAAFGSRPGKKRGFWYWEMLGVVRALSGG